MACVDDKTDLLWVAIEAIVIPMAVGLPNLVIPLSRTLWMALDLQIDRDVKDRQLRLDQMRRGPGT